MENIVNWFRRQYNNPQVIILAAVLIVGFALVIYAGKMIAPVIAGIVIAYILEGGVKNFEAIKVPRLGAVLIVLGLFLILCFALVFGILPLVSTQALQMASQIPSWIADMQAALLQLPEHYPEILSEEQVRGFIAASAQFVAEIGQQIVITWSASSVLGIITLVIYLILVPILVFFFLKDKVKLTDWLINFLPDKDHGLTVTVWQNVNRQMSNYIRGKFWEILIVGGVTYTTFTLFGLQYAALLSVIVGLSVLIPFVGAAVVTIPVVVVAGFQFGLSPEFAYVVGAYLIIQILDGNVLVPLIFSEVVDLHPVAIVVAVLVFGGLWGVWGVFFAIPLATLVQAVLISWPRANENTEITEQDS